MPLAHIFQWRMLQAHRPLNAEIYQNRSVLHWKLRSQSIWVCPQLLVFCEWPAPKNIGHLQLFIFSKRTIHVHSWHLIKSFTRKGNTMKMTLQRKSLHSLQQFVIVVLLFGPIKITTIIKHFKKLIHYKGLTKRISNNILETESMKVPFPKTWRSWFIKQLDFIKTTGTTI